MAHPRRAAPRGPRRDGAEADRLAAHANLAKGLFSALSVRATRINDGRTIVFVQRKEGGVLAWSHDPRTEARETIIGPEHALASGAIPLLFRSVRIGEEFFCDGSVVRTNC